MMQPVANLIETLSSNPGLGVREAGETILAFLSGGTIGPDEFQENPTLLTATDHKVPRYLAQVVWRALQTDYETLDELLMGLRGVLDRAPPVIEARASRRSAIEDRVVVPEARVLRIGKPIQTESGGWETNFEAHVTSGPLRDQEIEVRACSSVNHHAFSAIPYFWIHSSVAAYNLVPRTARTLEAGPDSFFVLEPLRQVNATSIARSLDCPKPEVDQIRQGRGDTTIHTVRGMLVHAIFEYLIQGEDDVEVCYRKALPTYLMALASLVDDDFDEDAFRREVIRHAASLREWIDKSPHVREDSQLELRRYSGTIGIQGRIDAVFKTESMIDLVELKTGRRIRPEDHAQVFIYRLLLTDLMRRARAVGESVPDLNARILSSSAGTSTPLQAGTDFMAVLETRNRLLSLAHGLGREHAHPNLPWADYDPEICRTCPPWTRSRCQANSARFGDVPDAAETPDLAYFRRFVTRVQREGWQANQDLADLLDDSRLGFRLKNLRTICNARSETVESGEFVFYFEENLSELTAGDRVLIHSGSISSQNSFHGYVRSIGPQQARIAVPLKNLADDHFVGRSWTIDRFSVDLTSEASQTALYDFLRAPMDERKRVVLGELHEGPGTARSSAVADSDLRSDLNTSQREAVTQALGCETFHLVWGPPGTGKTQIVAEIVAHTKGGVLLGAFTNTAVDKMLMALLDADPEMAFVRIGRSGASPELAARLGERRHRCFSEDLAVSCPSARELRRVLDDTPVIAATAHRAATLPYVRGRSFEMALVDEAGQLTEPLTLGLVLRARRFVLIGDDRQLPPVVRTPSLESSLFERLKAAAIKARPDRVTLLDVQYRMHPEIMALPNKLYYEGALRCGVKESDRQPPSGPPVSFVGVVSQPEGRSNLAEAETIAAMVDALLQEVPAADIGVIAPFRAQVVVLRKLLAETGVAVDTVERFQGGERDIILMSFVRSRGSDFVFDDRRLNVAFTRARRKLVLVGHPSLFDDTKYAWISNFRETSATGRVKAGGVA